jgi:predicted MFS family arabinose efflux permease
MVAIIKTSAARLISGGLCSLVVAMGVGRFAYTPLLPGMQEQFGFNDTIAGIIASLNYVGYLLGAVLCQRSLTNAVKLWGFRYSLVTSLLTTLTMGLFGSEATWMVLRFLGGLASAAVFVLGSAIVMDQLEKSTSSHLAMLIYSGVGLGIAFSGAVSSVLTKAFGVQNAWIGLAILCMPLAAWCWHTLVLKDQVHNAQRYQKKETKVRNPNSLGWLSGAYFCEGFGYIVSGTFLVAFLKQTAGVNSSGEAAWIIVGLSASAAVPFFYLLSGYWRPLYVLIFAYGLQALGIMLPVISKNWLAINCGAILFGGTFMGITALSLYIGKTMRTNNSQAVIGLLTAVYGVGQILGPLVSGILSTHTGTFTLALILSSATVALGGLLLMIGMFRSEKGRITTLSSNKEETMEPVKKAIICSRKRKRIFQTRRC